MAPSFYASTRGAKAAAWREWWTLLHPPYTLWHLSYVVIGACLAPRVDAVRLAGTVLAFFLAVGVAAHALDELHGRPMDTSIPSSALVAAAIVGLGGAVAVGLAGIGRVGTGLAAFIAVGVVLALGYNLELFGGLLHNDIGFALAWGSFPVLTGYFAQSQRITITACGAAVFAYFLARSQRNLSSPARALRRATRDVQGVRTDMNGEREEITLMALLAPLEATLRTLTWATFGLAVTLAVARLSHRL